MPRYRVVGLRKAVKNTDLLVCRQTNAGVADFKGQHHLVLAAVLNLHTHANLALGGELDGVAAQVDQHLLEAVRIANDNLRHQWVYIKMQGQRLSPQIGRQNSIQIKHQLADFKRLWVQHHLASLDF